jgi:hypothetical protein
LYPGFPTSLSERLLAKLVRGTAMGARRPITAFVDGASVKDIRNAFSIPMALGSRYSRVMITKEPPTALYTHPIGPK